MTVLPEKLALFDFDETLVDFDTVNPFIRFVLKAHPELDVPPDMTLPHKQYRLLLLKGLLKEEVDRLAWSYYQKQVCPNLIEGTLDKLRILQQEGYYICLVSGSYDSYLTHFVQEYRIDRLICTKIGFLDGVCTGRFDGPDCLGANKLTLLEEVFGTQDFTKIDSIAFSDAQSDLPLLRSCRKAVVVVARKNRIEPWMENDSFERYVYDLGLSKILSRKILWHVRRALRVSN